MAAHYAEGRYFVKVLAQAMGKSKNKGTPEFSLRFMVLGMVDPENPDGDLIGCSKFERTMYMYITDKTAERLCEDLQRIGFEKDSFKFLNPDQIGFHDFKDSEFEAFCKHELYEGKAQEKWSIAFAGARPLVAAQPLDDKGIRELDNLFGKHLKKAAKPEPAKMVPAKTIHGQEGVDTAQMRKANAELAEATAGEDCPF